MKMGKALFITGTGTDIGKTYVTGLIVVKLVDSGRRQASYYKAALSGAEPGADGRLEPGDALFVKEMAGLAEPVEKLVSYIYREEVSPHLAAKLNDRPIDFERVKQDFAAARSGCEFLTMEGSGGIICPLRWDDEQKVILDDLLKALKIPALVIADAGLGTINAAVLTIEHLCARAIPIAGVFLNNFHPGDRMEEDNRQMIEAITGVPVLAVIEPGAQELDMDAAALAALYE